VFPPPRSGGNPYGDGFAPSDAPAPPHAAVAALASGTVGRRRRAGLGHGLPPAAEVGTRLVTRLLVGVVVLALLVPYGITLALFWSRSGNELSATETGRQGVTYLRPLIRLLSAAVDRQSSVLTGTAGEDQRLQAALHEMEVMDSRLGEALGTRDRWTDVRQRLTVLLGSPPASTAYRDYGQAVDLIVVLIGSIAERSAPALDPDMDTYYLMDATALKLPSLLVTAGRLSDVGRTPGGARSVEAIVLASGLYQQAKELVTSLRRSFAAPRGATVTAGLIPALDKFSDATTVLVPGLMGRSAEIPSGDQLVAARQRLRDTTLDLSETSLTQMETQLRTRTDDLRQERRLIAGGILAGALIAVVGLWLLAFRRRGFGRAETVLAAPADSRTSAPGAEGGASSHGVRQDGAGREWAVGSAGERPGHVGPRARPGADRGDEFRWIRWSRP
jgi:hypothetical protein